MISSHDFYFFKVLNFLHPKGYSSELETERHYVVKYFRIYFLPLQLDCRQKWEQSITCYQTVSAPTIRIHSNLSAALMALGKDIHCG